jgi:hypothetical protein
MDLSHDFLGLEITKQSEFWCGHKPNCIILFIPDNARGTLQSRSTFV